MADHCLAPAVEKSKLARASRTLPLPWGKSPFFFYFLFGAPVVMVVLARLVSSRLAFPYLL
jgi:hypothetical protein